MRTSNTSERLKQIMQERRLRQVDILALCAPWCDKYSVKMNRSDISQYVSGKVEPSQEKLIVLALALGVTETWLMGYDIGQGRFAETLKRLRLARGMTQEEFADLLGTSKQNISRYESGAVSPKISTAQSIADKLGISLTELNGAGDLPAGIIPVNALHPQQIPYLGEAAAGTPILTDQQYDAYISVDHPIKADACIRIHGDSMTPAYHDGDIVYIRQQDAVDDGAVAVVIVDNSAALKHVYRTSAGVMLTSDNPAYPPQRYSPEECSDLNIHIYGIPVGFTRMFKGADQHG